MKTKFLIPVLAMIFAVGMSFTTVDLGDKAASDYILVNNNWQSIPEIDCGQTGQYNCQVRLQDGSVHFVYDHMSTNSVKETPKNKPFELPN